jgi:hypothetical protein
MSYFELAVCARSEIAHHRYSNPASDFPKAVSPSARGGFCHRTPNGTPWIRSSRGGVRSHRPITLPMATVFPPEHRVRRAGWPFVRKLPSLFFWICDNYLISSRLVSFRKFFRSLKVKLYGVFSLQTTCYGNAKNPFGRLRALD